jgi:DHA2 family methylenomycin A resistance protein-like MFS transporter
MRQHIAWSRQGAARPSARSVLAATSLAWLIVVLDATVVNVAVERVQASFGTGMAGMQWVVNGYPLVFSGFLLSGGALADRFGARRLFVAGFFLFTAASLACGAAPTLALLVGARAVQGLGGALLVPASLALLNHAYHDGAARARAVGIWTAVGGMGLVAGPVVGGLLVGLLGWRSIFFINLPIGLAGAWLGGRFARETSRRSGGEVDLPGQSLAVLALVAGTGALIEGGSLGWRSPAILGAAVLGLGAAFAFLWVERRSPSPMLPLGVFRRTTFAATVGIGFLINMAAWGLVFVLSLYLQKVKGYSPLLTGLGFIPFTVLVTMANIIGGRLAARHSSRPPMVAGSLLGALGCLAWLGLGGNPSYALLTLPLLSIGAGIGLAVPPMTAAALAGLPKEQGGLASGILNAVRQAGGNVGVALFGALLGEGQGFLAGLEQVLIIAAAALLIAAAASFLWIHASGAGSAGRGALGRGREEERRERRDDAA